MRRPVLRDAGEARQLAEREIHLAGGATELVAPDRADEIFRQMLLAYQAEERAARIGARHDHRCAQLVAVLEHHAGGAAARDEHLSHRSPGPDVSPMSLRGGGDGGAHRAVAALGEAPGAEHAVEL